MIELMVDKDYYEFLQINIFAHAMDSRFDRLVALVEELRGDSSKRKLAKQLGVSPSSVYFWETRMSWPDPGSLRKLARMKGWTMAELQAYLEGEDLEADQLEQSLTVQQLLKQVRALPFEAAAKVARAALETMEAKGEQV
jgi:transcriptional regulator with XRE-family HTH domain